MRLPLIPLALFLTSVVAAPFAAARLASATVESSSAPTAQEQDARRPVTDPVDADAPAVDQKDAAVVIRVRVVDARGGAIPDDVRVRLMADHRNYRGSTDRSGEVEFPLQSVPRGALVVVEPSRGWRWRASPRNGAVALDDAQRRGEAPLVATIAHTEIGIVEGLVVDDATGEPVPGYRFTLQRPGGSADAKGDLPELVTDGQGRFRTPRAIRGGNWFIRAPLGEPRVADESGQWDCLVPTADHPEPAELRVLVGATYDLELTGAVPVDPTTLRVLVVNRSSGRDRGGASPRVDGDRVWVRLSSGGFQDEGPAFLAVIGVDGFLAGTATLGDGAPRRDGTVRVVLERTGSVRLRDALIGANEGLADDRRLGFERRLEALDPELLDETTSWRLGKRSFLRPGRYRWTAWSREHARRSADFEVVPGVVHRPAEALPRLEAGRLVRGTIEWTDEPLGWMGCIVHVRTTSQPVRDFRVEYGGTFSSCMIDSNTFYAWDEDGDGRVVEFELPHVPLGPLEVVGSDYVGRVADVRQERDEDGTVVLHLVFTDPRAGTGFGFALDAEAAAPPNTNWPIVHARDLSTGELLPSFRTRGGVIDRRDAAGLEREWALARENCKPLYFAAADFAPDASGRAIVPAHFRPGWGARVRVLDDAGEPVAGAALLLDSLLAGTSDANGWCALESSVAPTRAVVRHGNVERVVTLGGPWTDVTLPRGE